MSATAQANSQRERLPWLRFLAFGCILAIGLVVVVTIVWVGGRAERERRALAEISQVVGTYTMESAVNPQSVVHRLPHFARRFYNRVYKLDLSTDALDLFAPELRTQKRPLTDEDLVLIASFFELRELDLENTAITDAGLTHLRGLHSLRVLNLSGTSVTTQGRADLQKALPKCKIK